MEMLLTVEQAATRLQLAPLTIRRQLQSGQLRGIKRGRVWRVPESAILESSLPSGNPSGSPSGSQNKKTEAQTAGARAAAILVGLDSGDGATRNAAILALSRADAKTCALVEQEAARSVAQWDGPEEDLSDWRALDGEPFHFPEEREAEAAR